jgi:hypothetical protein
MFFVNNTIRLPGNPRGKGCQTVSFIQEISLRSFFVILKSAWDICIQIKLYNCISVNQHGIWSTIVYMRPRVVSKAVQIRNFKSASLLAVKMSHRVPLLRVTYRAPARSVQKLSCWNSRKWSRWPLSFQPSEQHMPSALVSNSSSSFYRSCGVFLVRRVSSEGSSWLAG